VKFPTRRAIGENLAQSVCVMICSMSAGVVPAANEPPTTDPMLVPVTQSTGTRSSSSTLRTPICAARARRAGKRKGRFRARRGGGWAGGRFLRERNAACKDEATGPDPTHYPIMQRSCPIFPVGPLRPPASAERLVRRACLS